jgi:hypothetical protein
MTQNKKTPGVIMLGEVGNSSQDITFQFGEGTDGLTYLNLNGTYHYDEQALKPNPALWLCPCCWCILCMWSIAAGSHDQNAVVHEEFNNLASRIHFALQASLQNGTINGGGGNMMMMQQPQGTGGMVVQPQQSTFQVQIPPNFMAGMMLTVQAPDGQQVQIQVPPGVAPGTMVAVPYTPQVVVQPVVKCTQVAPAPVMTR